MADLPQQITIKQYYGNGAQATFTVPFFTPLESDGTPDLDVYVTPPGQIPIPETDIKIYSVDYTFTPDPVDPINNGGTVIFLTGHIPANLSVVTVVRNISASLDVNFSDAQNFSGVNLDTALDKLTLICQQLQTYTQQRNLSYVVNALQPDTVIEANTQLPQLGANQIWQGNGFGVAAVTLEENPDVSTLRSELANEAPSTNGAAIVGYYDTVDSAPTTVAAFLNNLIPFLQTQLGATGQIVVPGTVIDYAGASLPGGYLNCDGSAVSRTTYAALFAALGTAWGIGDGTTTFNIPDFRRRVSVGSGGSGSGTLGNAVGNTGGAETVTLDTTMIPGHTHTFTSTTQAYTVSSSANSFGGSGTNFGPTGVSGTTASTGGGAAHNNIQPSAVVMKCIKY